MERPFPAYKGNEPYVFVCYAHDDADVVYSELMWLRDQGCNIWYDEGITPGEEWNDEIAGRIEGAAHFLYFVTPASVESRHCKGELQFALSHSTRVVCVHLKSTALPAGLELQLGPTQAILKDELSGSSYEAKLLESLACDASSNVARVHEARGGRPNSWRKAGGFALAAAVLVMIAYGVWVTDRSVTDPASVDTENATIAIFPFENLSSDSADQYFTDAMAAELVIRLSRLENVQVKSFITGSSADTKAALEAGVEDPAEMGRKLGVHYLLRGTVFKVGSKVRITARLTDTTTGFVAWTDEFKGEIGDVFAFQEDTTLQIANALGVHLSPQEQRVLARRPTENPDAYEAYLKGWAYIEMFHTRTTAQITEANLQAASKHFNKALTLDPDYALALAGLSLVETGYIFVGLDRDPERLDRGRELAVRALEADSSLSEVHVAMANVHGNSSLVGGPNEFGLAVDRYYDALNLDSENAYTLCELGFALNNLGSTRSIEAEKAVRKAIELRPGYFYSHATLGYSLQLQGRYDDAKAAYEYAVELKPEATGLYANIGLMDLYTGDYRDALEWFVKAPETPWLLVGIGAAHAALGETEPALASLEQAIAAGYKDVSAIQTNPLFASVRDDPRFLELIGL